MSHFLDRLLFLRIACHNLVASLHGWPLHSAARERAQRVAGTGQDHAAYMTALRVPVGDITELKQGSWVYEAKKEFGLLAAAFQEANTCLTAAERTEVQRLVQESTVTALRKEEEEQLQFEGGAS